ncbi:hypothetical protein RHS04_05051 [Rhizoctonia solani]|uniref:Uncharacterized protein n=1 Tax=Rhizoctonia solani TaxID=456999 RepID=A0A8H7H8K5_9AGAM|nr:hypothetical protein RHS04_05051 [Rhizoctonia solani]
MPKHRQRHSDSHQLQLARRFLQLDADIRLAAAADGLFPFQKERPESPAQVYPYDAQLQHPKPKLASGAIQIRQLEHMRDEQVAKAKPSLKTRSVSDPGDAHRLISRFVPRPEQKSRSMTVNGTSTSTSTSTSAAARVFPFPSKGSHLGVSLLYVLFSFCSILTRALPALENFIEMESTADEIGYDDPLALKMGQILARRAAAATRAISGSSRRSSRHSSVASGRRSVDSNGRRSVDSQRSRSRLRIQSILDVVGEGSKPVESKRDSALLLPPPVVVDDRSPQEGSSRFWPRAPKSKGLGVGGVGSASLQQQQQPQQQQQRQSPPGAHDLLNTFTFPSVPRPLSPPTREPESESLSQPSSSHFAQPSSHFGSQPPSHFGTSASTNANMPSYQLHIQTRVPLTVQTNLDPYSDQDPAPVSPVMFHEDARSVSFVMHGSPTSGVYVSPVESMSPTSLRFSMIERSFEALAAGERESVLGVEVYDDAMTSFDPTTTSPRTSRIQTSPTTTRVQNPRVQASPTTVRVQTSPTMMRATVHSSPTMMRVQASPAAMRNQPTTTRFQQSPSASRFQSSPSTTVLQNSPSTALFQNSPSTSRIHSSPYQNSPTGGRFPQQQQQQSTPTSSRIPVARQTSSSDNRYNSSPATSYSQPSPNTPFQSSIPIAARPAGTPVRKPTPLRTSATPIQRPPSNAHLDLLRGLSPLPSHGLPLPAPMRNSLKRGSLLGDVMFGVNGNSRVDEVVGGDMSTLAVEDLSVRRAAGDTSVCSILDSSVHTHTSTSQSQDSSTRAFEDLSILALGYSPIRAMRDLSTMAAENVFASDRSLGPTSPEEPHLNGEQGPSIREWTPPPPATPTPPSTPLPSHSFSSPGNGNGGFTSASPVNVFSTPERNGFSTPNAASTPVKPTTTTPEVMSTTPLGAPPLFPARALSPIPARLRRMTPDPGSASDEVVFRGSSSSASSTPQKRKRRRTRLPVRAHSEGFIHIPSADFSRSGEINVEAGGRTRSGSGSGGARRTAQSLIRRRQTGDGGEVSSDGRDVVLFVPKSLGPPSRAASPTKSRAGSPAKSQVPSPSKSHIPSPSKSRVSSPSKSYVPSSPSKSRVPSPSKARVPSPAKQSSAPVASSSRPMPPPMIRRSSIPLPDASPTQLAPPPMLGLLGAEPFMTSSQELPRRPSIELREPIIVQPQPSQPLERLPWSPPRHMFSRMETASRDGSFHTARDSPAQSTDVDFPGSFPHTETPVHMVENQEGSSSAGHSAVTAEENPLVQSAMRAMVSRPVTMTITRRPSGEFAPSAHGSSTPARRAASVHSFVPGGLVPPASLAPSPSIPGLSHTPNSSNGGCSIPVRHDQHYSPPESLPESVTPPTDASRPPTERSNSHPGNESFYSAHAADSDIRLPVESWIAFTMGNMDANGLPITRATFDELQSSEDESAAVAEVLSRHSARRPDSAVILDDMLPHDYDNDSGESAGQSLSDVGTTPSPSRSGSRHSGWLADAAPAGTNGHLTVQTSDLDWAEEDGNTSAFSLGSDTSESNRRTVDRLQTVASIVHELNVRTPIPSASSSHLRGPPSLATTSAAYVTPPSFANPPPYRSSHSAPSRTLSPGAVSITFSEASPSLSTIPPPSLVVPSENRNWFADSLVLAEYRHSLYLRDDDQRALEEGEDVILYGGDWEHVGRRSESRATTNSAVPVEAPVDYTPNATDRQSRNKYIQFVLSVAGALRTGAPPRSQRMVENVLRPLRRQPSQPGPRYEDLYDEIGRDEAGSTIPAPPPVPSDLSTTSSSSSDIDSALPDDDEIVEDFVRSIMTPQPGTPHRPPPPILIQGSNVLPWPALPSPVSPRIRFARSVSRQTTRSQATSITHITSSHSGYSSLIPPPPRPRPRSLEPHWLTIYVAGRWPIPDTYVTRRTYSSPSALGPPMPYLWRPICHISPERLWEITNFEAQVPVPSQLPPAHSPHSPLNARQHFPTPATTQNHATTYSFSTSSTTSSRSNMMLPPPPTVYPDVGFRTSHANLQIDSLSALPPLPPSVPTLMEHQLSNTSIPVRDHLASRLSLGSTISSPRRPSTHPRSPSSRIVTPVAMSRKRTLKELVGKITGRGTRVRTHSIHSRNSSPFVPKPKFGVAGKVVELSRRIFRRGRRARLESIRSQVQRTSPET